MRQGNQIDLRTQGGARQVTVLPGASVEYTFQSQQSRIGAGGGGRGLYNLIRGINLECFITIVRTGTTSDPIHHDKLPLAVKSINLNSPMFGTMIDPTVMTGIVCRELNNYVGNGYSYDGHNQTPVPLAAGTYFKRTTLFIPFSQKWNVAPDHFALWLGWLNDATLEIFVNDAANPFDIGTPGANAATITDVKFQATLDMIPSSEIIVPPLVVLRKYQQAAGASSNGPVLINVGSAGALQGVEDASRLMGMYFSHQLSGFTGSGLAEQIATLTLPWRDQAQTVFMDAMLARFLQTSHMRPRMGFLTAGANISDGTDTTTPYVMPLGAPDAGIPALNAGALNSNLRYTPLVWPEMEGLISQLQKVKGNYPLDMTFTTTQTGMFTTYLHEMKQISVDKCSEMLAAAGIDPGKVQLVPKLAKKNFKTQEEAKMWCLPRSVLSR